MGASATMMARHRMAERGKTLPVFISYASQEAVIANSIVENLGHA